VSARAWTRYAVVCLDPGVVSQYRYPARRVWPSLTDAERYVKRGATRGFHFEIHLEVGP
jgi:hypothetical protein